MRKIAIATLCAGAVIALASCGETTGEQALLGAGAGAATAAIVNGDWFAGALIGGAGNVAYCKQNPGKCN